MEQRPTPFQLECRWACRSLSRSTGDRSLRRRRVLRARPVLAHGLRDRRGRATHVLPGAGHGGWQPPPGRRQADPGVVLRWAPRRRRAARACGPPVTTIGFRGGWPQRAIASSHSEPGRHPRDHPASTTVSRTKSGLFRRAWAPIEQQSAGPKAGPLCVSRDGGRAKDSSPPPTILKGLP